MRPVHALPVAVIALAVALLAGAGTSTAGSVFTVDRLDDASPIPDACTAAANDCSFRGAVEAANNKSGADTIMVPPGTYTLAIANSVHAGDRQQRRESEPDRRRGHPRIGDDRRRRRRHYRDQR